MKIEWRVISCAPQYEVSNTGLIKRIDTQHLRKIQTNKKGYQQVSLNSKIYSVHRLVAIAFIPNPNNYAVVNHKDENPSNNWVTNLEWCTQEYNLNYGTARQRISSTARNRQEGTPVYCPEVDKVFYSQAEASRQLNVPSQDINSVLRGRQKTARGYTFEYYNAER